MKPLDWIMLLFAAAIAFWQFGVPQMQAAVPDEPASGRLLITSEAGLPAGSNAARQFEVFTQEVRYFGAFAVTETGEARFTRGRGNEEVARARALSVCAQTYGTPCSIHAVMLPEDDQADLPEPMASGAAKAYRSYRLLNGYKAMAISNSGAWGRSWGYDTKMQAQSRAMHECKINLKPHKPGAYRFEPCRLIAGR